MGATELKGGLTLPDDVIVLANDLERDGFTMRRADDQLVLSRTQGESVSPSVAERSTEIRKWKAHLLAVVDYCEQHKD